MEWFDKQSQYKLDSQGTKQTIVLAPIDKGLSLSVVEKFVRPLQGFLENYESIQPTLGPQFGDQIQF